MTSPSPNPPRERTPPAPGLVVRGLGGILRLYQLLLSPWLGRACRFEPSCSAYARESIETHGVGRGIWYALRRLLRCHPFCAGGFDPVPPRAAPRRAAGGQGSGESSR
ncbi:MAG: membrane protein insertion efficiency factor YidD [Myxococcales bacterium]|nr:membrane protein insertion efficiency factor YidD [Myxococcales bacterium]